MIAPPTAAQALIVPSNVSVHINMPDTGAGAVDEKMIDLMALSVDSVNTMVAFSQWYIGILTVGLAVLAIWGYNNLKTAAEGIARKTAEDTAKSAVDEWKTDNKKEQSSKAAVTPPSPSDMEEGI